MEAGWLNCFVPIDIPINHLFVRRKKKTNRRNLQGKVCRFSSAQKYFNLTLSCGNHQRILQISLRILSGLMSMFSLLQSNVRPNLDYTVSKAFANFFSLKRISDDIFWIFSGLISVCFNAMSGQTSTIRNLKYLLK